MSHSAAIRTSVPSAHTLGSHSDVSGSPARGDLYVRSAAGLWVPKTLGAVNTFLASDGLDPNYRAIVETDIADGALLARLAANETVAGTWAFTPGLKERGRTVAMGEWTAVAYAAGDYTASGGATWTVAEADVVTHAYALIGKTLLLIVWVQITDVTVATPNDLQIKLPGGFASARTTSGSGWGTDNGTPSTLNIRIAAAGTQLLVSLTAGTAWQLSAANTQVRLSMTLEVS